MKHKVMQLAYLTASTLPYIYYGSLVLALGSCTLIARLSLTARGGKNDTQHESLEFQGYRRNFIFMYLTMSGADWLQGPYIYAVYEHYGFKMEEIGSLFLTGYIASMVAGPFVGAVADRL